MFFFSLLSFVLLELKEHYWSFTFDQRTKILHAFTTKQLFSQYNRNVGLERVVERFTSKAKSAVEVKCTYCAPPPRAATKTCVDCSVS